MKSGRVARQVVHTTGQQRESRKELGTGMLTGSDNSLRPCPVMETLGFSTDF